MTEKQRLKSSTLRTRGWAWFVFAYGMLRYGLSWGVSMFIASQIHLFAMESHSLKSDIPALLIASTFFGTTMATLQWRRNERQFRQA